MNNRIPALLILACLTAQACAPDAAQPAPSLPRTFELSQERALFIDIDSGTLDIAGSTGAQVEIAGLPPSTARDGLSTSTASDGLHISLRRPSGSFWPGSQPYNISIRLPRGHAVHINNYSAAIRLHAFDGDANITSLAGQVSIQDCTGHITINANRADVLVTSTSGEIHLAGNYGLLSMTDTHGAVSASTIMGTLRFAGTIAASDEVSLETDHGPIEIRLAGASDVAVKAGTTTGVVTCTVPSLRYAGQGCAGSLNGGLGQLTVRTVSGGVSLQPLP